MGIFACRRSLISGLFTSLRPELEDPGGRSSCSVMYGLPATHRRSCPVLDGPPATRLNCCSMLDGLLAACLNLCITLDGLLAVRLDSLCLLFVFAFCVSSSQALSCHFFVFSLLFFLMPSVLFVPPSSHPSCVYCSLGTSRDIGGGGGATVRICQFCVL